MTTMLPPPAPAHVLPFTPVPVPEARRGRLVAAGTMSIVGAVPALLFGLYVLTLSRNETFRLIDSATGNTISFVGAVIVLVAGLVITFGIAACSGRNWGRIGVLVTHAIFGAGWMASGVAGLFSHDRTSSLGTMIGLLGVMTTWFGAVLFLAATGRPRRRAA